MSDNTVEINIVASNKSGLLSFLMLSGSKVGLIYKKKQDQPINQEKTRVNVIFTGALKCSKDDFIALIESSPDVFLVEDVTVNGQAAPTPVQKKKAPQKATSFAVGKLNSSDPVSPEAKHLAEEKLATFLGPVASMLVDSAAQEASHVGDMFSKLAIELDGSEKDEFLSLLQ